jgi:antitoxin component of MazEF toxin-antitoxin module
MGVRKKIVKWGNSLAVRIPKVVLRQAVLREGIELKISVKDGHIWLEPSNPFDRSSLGCKPRRPALLSTRFFVQRHGN